MRGHQMARTRTLLKVLYVLNPPQNAGTTILLDFITCLSPRRKLKSPSSPTLQTAKAGLVWLLIEVAKQIIQASGRLISSPALPVSILPLVTGPVTNSRKLPLLC